MYIYIQDPEIWRRNYRDANRTQALSMVRKAFVKRRYCAIIFDIVKFVEYIGGRE